MVLSSCIPWPSGRAAVIASAKVTMTLIVKQANRVNAMQFAALLTIFGPSAGGSASGLGVRWFAGSGLQVIVLGDASLRIRGSPFSSVL